MAGVAATALIFAGCAKSDDSTTSDPAATSAEVSAAPTPEIPSSLAESASEVAEPTEVTITGERDVEVTLTGPIAARYSSATEEEKTALGLPLTGDRNAGARESGMAFQQFQGGVITAVSEDPGSPAYITWGKIRDAWNIERAADGTPDISGDNGSVGPLGAPTSDELTEGDLKVTTFQHGKITYNPTTDVVEVTVNGNVVPSGL
ncbi:hypothetical protein MBRU_00740 [Mycolicibacterium brumae DSM 44177]|nr:hypothetical protein MBRU_00740 [Mycolicibacterium brumae DSM 44177]